MKIISDKQYIAAGERVIIVQFKQEISIDVNNQVYSYVHLVKNANISGVEQIIPAFSSVAIRYNPLEIGYNDIVDQLKRLDSSDIKLPKEARRTIYIPIVYGGEDGPDLIDVAKKSGLSIEEVIKIHSSKEYLVYMLGFIASYPYCGNLDKRLSLPRKKTPQLKVQKGTIAIANQQTIIYPIESPGGWHNIGRTPLETFNPLLSPPSIFNPGDYIKFKQISLQDAEEWSEREQKQWWEKWNL